MGLASAAHAQEALRASDAIDLQDGTVIGSPRLMGMGGTGIASQGRADALGLNPAAGAAREFDLDSNFEFDGHLGLLVPSAGTDSDGDGRSREKAFALEVAYLIRFHSWTFANTVRFRAMEADWLTGPVDLWSMRGETSLSKSLWRKQLIVGAGFGMSQFTLEDQQGLEALVSTQLNANAGVIYRPEGRNVRFGLTGRTPIGRSKRTTTCVTSDGEDCLQPDWPRRSAIPWDVGVGVAYRFAPSAWNEESNVKWRDERALIVAADLNFHGPIKGGVALPAAAQGMRQASGSSLTTSLHVGAEYEWVPSWLRVRAGSYWEGARIDEMDGSAGHGRLHGTAGFEFRFAKFHAIGRENRLALSSAVDLADRYLNWTVSVGLW